MNERSIIRGKRKMVRPGLWLEGGDVPWGVRKCPDGKKKVGSGGKGKCQVQSRRKKNGPGREESRHDRGRRVEGGQSPHPKIGKRTGKGPVKRSP